MEQGLNNFNAGKYKEALNQLNSAPQNTDSNQPNIAICEYLSSRTLNSSQACLRKLCTLMMKRNKKDHDIYERITDQVIKYNIGILMLLTGRKDNAYLIISDVYRREKCFIDFMKYRMLLLLMELSLGMKNNVEALSLACSYISAPYEQRTASNQWISLIFHEHSKSFAILKEELDFMVCIFMSQAIIQLRVSEIDLPPDDTRIEVRDVLLEKARKRKNNTNKYYEINLLMIDRFHQAHREFHNCLKNADTSGVNRAISLLHFSNIQNDFDQMPQTKIITNIYSSLSINNTAVIFFASGRPNAAAYLFNKAQTLLAKGCTGVEDKDLQLFSANYASHNFKITYNLALTCLSKDSVQSYHIFDYFKKVSLLGQDYKSWYRAGQSQLQYYFENYTKMNEEGKSIILKTSYKSFLNSLQCLKRREVPTLEVSKSILNLKEEEIDAITNKMRAELQMFKQNILLIITYINLLLKKYHRAILYAKELINSEKTRDQARFIALQYLMEAYGKTNYPKDMNKTMNQLEKLVKEKHKKMILSTHYFTRSEILTQNTDISKIISFQNMVLKIKQKNINDAKIIFEKQRNKSKKSQIFSDTYLKKCISSKNTVLKSWLYPRKAQQQR